MALPVFASIDDCIDATCRVSDGAGKPLGTGSVFRLTADRVFVLTNAHVVEGHQAVACEFWQRGHQSKPLLGQVAWQVRNDECDAAVVVLDLAQFGEFPPTVIPLAPPNYLIRPGETLVSVGCPRGEWATAWKGHAKGYIATDLRFLPTPAGGRSGSAIFNADGTLIVGLLFARTANDSEGLAVSLQAIYKHLEQTIGASTGTPSDTARELCEAATWGVPTPIEWSPGPAQCQGGCPGGQCPHQRPNRQFQLFGKQEHQQEYKGSPYPSLPIPPPSAPLAPLVPVNPNDTEARARLDVLERDVAGLRTAFEKAVKEVEEKLGTAVGTAETETATAKQEVEGLKGEMAEAVKEVGGIPGLIKKAREEGAEGYREIARKVVWGIIGSYGWPVGGAVGLAFFLLWRRIDAKREAGEPLLYERAIGRVRERVGDLPDDALVSRIADRVRGRLGGLDEDGLAARLADRVFSRFGAGQSPSTTPPTVVAA